MARVDPRTRAHRPGLAGAVAQGDVRRREPESQSGPEPSDRSRDRQEKCKGKKTEEQETATAGPDGGSRNADRRGPRNPWRRSRAT